MCFCLDSRPSLRYLYESYPQLHVIAAGSLMDFALEKVGLPVGRVSSFYLFPLSFVEFLGAKKEQLLIQELLNHDGYTPIAEVIHNKFLDLLGEYFAIGGMPEAVVKWLEFRDPKECFQVHFDLANAYRQDFEKYGKKHQIKYIEQLFSQIPHFIGEQFQYKNIPGGSRKRELAPSLDLLEKSNVVHRIYHSSAHGMPIGAGQNLNWFKMTFLDIALCQTILGLDLRTWFLDPNREFVNRGNIAEAFVGQEFLSYSSPIKIPQLFYWRKAERSSSAEIDYLFVQSNQILPVEVKSGVKGTLRSMNLFLKSHPETPYGLLISQNNFSTMKKINSMPLYSLITLADEDQKEAATQL